MFAGNAKCAKKKVLMLKRISKDWQDRVFPIFAPLFFLFTVARTFNQKAKVSPGKSLAGVGIACLSLIIWSNPFAVSVQQVQTTYEKWTVKPDDSEKAFVWINKNTPNGTIVIAPPWRFDYWHLSQRAQIVSYNQPTYSNLNEWQKRVDQLVGIPNPENGIRKNYELASFYYNLRQKQVDRLAGRYKAVKNRQRTLKNPVKNLPDLSSLF